ncbi:MAG: alpha/beta hydrolase, partial [Kangiella sp.]|nr:alpha/beta hydrolase [Kangiella sp.]
MLPKHTCKKLIGAKLMIFTGKPVKKNWFRSLTMAIALIIALPVLVFIAGSMRDPTLSLHAVAGSMLWATFGPHLVLLSFVALILSLGGFRHEGSRRAKGRFARLTLILSIIAFLGSTYITVRILASVFAAGGAANPVSGLLLKSMNAGGPDESVVFRTIDSQALSAAIYKPASNNQRVPVLIYIHGGGFMTGSNIETDADLRWFSEQGWLVFSIDYRLFTPDIPTWDKAPQDVACAVAWVDANAAEYGGDPGRLGVLGDSAGGNLAINVAYAAALGNDQSDCGRVPVPQAVVVQYPAVDPLAIFEDGYPIPGFEPKMLFSGYIGGTLEEFPDRVHAVSSSSYISNNAPPTLILEPEKDSIVPSESVYRFAEQALLAGV